MKLKEMYISDKDVAWFEKLTNVSAITIQPFEYAIPSFIAVPDSIFVSLQGKALELVPYDGLDLADNIGKFTIDTNNRLVFIVDPALVPDIKTARQYVSGYHVCYLLKPLTYTDNIPTYTVRTYDIQNYLVSETLPMDLPQVMNKIKCLDANLNLEEGYYYHVVVRALQ